MSDKSSLSYCNTKELYFHLFYSFNEGYNFDIRVGNMSKSIRIKVDENEAEDIKNQLDSSVGKVNIKEKDK